MKATAAKLLPFLKKSDQFVIPIYQRTFPGLRKSVNSCGATSCALEEMTLFLCISSARLFT
ncbi:hypothetical protein BH20ACI3_BH20ACI3_24370 [soil metagenome]